MSIVITELNISCSWGGILTGILLKNNNVEIQDRLQKMTMKIIGIHGWLDNLNSMLPLARKLIEHNPNYEIYLYDQAGHGFSSHIPKGFDCSDAHNHQDLRTVLQTLGWTNEQITIIGHSYGAMLGMIYAASYPQEVRCFIAIDALIRERVSPESYWPIIGKRINKRLEILTRPSKIYKEDLTFDKAIEIIKITRPGLDDSSARLLTERCIQRDKDNKLYFTRDESLKILSLYPYTQEMVRNAVISIKASVLFIGSTDTHWIKPQKTLDLFQTYHSNFELSWFDGPHHLHMTRVDIIVDRIEQYFNRYLSIFLTPIIEKSKL